MQAPFAAAANGASKQKAAIPEIVDAVEREQALDPSRSFIVEAPAGSGKTGLLTQRFLRLLALVEQPESVVAVTFTRKAAAEMRERIHGALLRADKNEPVTDAFERRIRELANEVLANNRKRDWNLLVDAHRLQVQTIDSLCLTLARHMPVVSGLGGAPEPIEDARELYRLAAQRLLRSLADSTPEHRMLLAAVALHFDNNLVMLERNMAEMLEHRDRWLRLEADGSELVEWFRGLLNRAHGHVVEIFREYSVVDFIELTRAAIKALGAPEQPSDLLYWLDYKIQHVLVDEFQDTSFAQYDLLDSLTGQWSDGDGHTLFLVGDPMQSIYRFRGAEVSLFLECWKRQRLGSVRLAPVSLKTNFRSTPEILNWVETHFEPIMPNDVPGGVKFRPSQAQRKPGSPEPQLIALIDDEGSGEAARVVKAAAVARDQGSVAILVRARSHLNQIVPALRDAGVPYEAVEIENLSEQPHILDLFSLGRAISHLGDRTAWLACLRAPWCGLTLNDLATLAERERDRTILDLLSDPVVIARIDPGSRSRALRFAEILLKARARFEREPLAAVLEGTWTALGGPAILAGAYQLEDVRTFLALVSREENGGRIRDFSTLKRRLEGMFAKPASGENYVQVMTVHKAKGLEFDTVIIPQLRGRAAGYDRDLLMWSETFDENGEIRIRMEAKPRKGSDDQDYKEIAHAGDAKQREELKRLFYVACTRAKNQLVLCGSAELKKDRSQGFRKVSETTFLGLIWHSVHTDFEKAARRHFQITATQAPAKSTNRNTLRRLPAGWRVPHFDPSVEWKPELERSTASARRITYEWVSDTSRHVGTVVHELLKRAASGTFGLSALTTARPLIESELVRLGVSDSEQREAVVKVMRAVENTLRSERGSWILAGRAESRSEWPVAGRIQDKLISGTVDRAFRDDSDRMWIIDYKTSEHEGGKLESFLNEEERRYRTQLESYAVLISRLMPGPFHLGLYFPLLDAWREWQFKEEIAADYTGQ